MKLSTYRVYIGYILEILEGNVSKDIFVGYV